MRKKSGFTLIELLVVIAIIAILATVSITIYRDAEKNAADAKRKADVDAISKAFELYYSAGSYAKPVDGWFGSGGIPKDPDGSIYYWNGDNTKTPAAAAPTYTICAKLKISSGNSDDQVFTTYMQNNDGPFFCRKNIQ